MEQNKYKTTFTLYYFWYVKTLSYFKHIFFLCDFAS